MKLVVCATIAATASALSSVSHAVQFIDVTAPSGISFVNTVGDSIAETGLKGMMVLTMGNGGAVGDYDDDGDLDLYLCGQHGFPNVLYRNELNLGQKLFVDVTPAHMASLNHMSRSAQFVDLDSDYDLDLVVVNDSYADDGGGGASTSLIFRNDGGIFANVTPSSNFRPNGYLRCGTSYVDYNLDGRVDIYISDWVLYGLFGPPAFPGYNALYENRGSMQFEDVSVECGLGEYTRDCFSALFSDLDGNLYPDLYQAIDNRDDIFYWNQAGTFVEGTADVQLDHFGNDMGATACDFDDDGDLDIYATNITDPTGTFGSTQGNVLYVNKTVETGSVWFEDEAFARGAEDTYWGWGVEWVDVENDGDMDIIAGTGMDDMINNAAGPGHPLYQSPTVLLENDGAGNFTRATPVGLEDGDDTRGLVVFDYDRDGDMDVITMNVDQPTRLYENVSTDQGHWLEVRLAPDAYAIGAQVYATYGGVTKRRDIVHGDSYVVGTPSEVHFGLGAETEVATLEIRWADGVVEVFNNVAGDQVVDYTRAFVAVEPGEAGPNVAVRSPFPNPSRAQFSVPYTLDRAAPLELRVFDAQGRPVRSITVAANAGSGVIGWDGRTDGGASAAPGVYVYEIMSAGATLGSGKLVVSR